MIDPNIIKNILIIFIAIYVYKDKKQKAKNKEEVIELLKKHTEQERIANENK